MNNRILDRCVEIAKALKPIKQTGKSHHVSFAIKKSKIACIGINNYNKAHNTNKFGFYTNHKSLPGEYQPSTHSECSLATRLGEESWEDYEVVNVRIGNNNVPLLSCPCINCLKAVVIPLSPKRLFYSDSDGSFKELEY